MTAMIAFGDPRLPPRFWAKVRVDPVSGCWRWTGALNGNGYGSIFVGSKADGTNRQIGTHRLAYEALVGPIAEGFQLDHVRARGCFHRDCCFPGHLEPVTQTVNILRGISYAALNATKTICKNGHALTDGNVARKPSKPRARSCRACHRNEEARRRASRVSL